MPPPLPLRVKSCNLDVSFFALNHFISQELENRRDVMNTEVDMFGTSEGRRITTQKEQVQNVLQQMTTFCETTVRYPVEILLLVGRLLVFSLK